MSVDNNQSISPNELPNPESEPSLPIQTLGEQNELPAPQPAGSEVPGLEASASPGSKVPGSKGSPLRLGKGPGEGSQTLKKGRQGQGGGPKTPQGKARSSQNAVKHAIYSPVAVIPDIESPAERKRHRDGLFEYYLPQGYGEELLVSRLDSLSWRMMRAERHETAVVASQIADREPSLALDEAYARALEVDAFNAAYADSDLADDDDDDDDEDSPRNRALIALHRSLLREASLIPSGNACETAMRYESHLHRQYIQTLHELEALQARRNGLPSYLGRYDTSGPPKA
ncbi:MAG: hypothetical protein WEB04_11240 [Dehalococcoidia bacterium]